jgi:hypothetical protein
MTRRRRSRSVVSVVAVAAVALALVVGPVGGAGAITTCRVINRTAVPHELSYSLQAAVDAATPGDVLRVKGQCYGHTDIDRDLTINGRRTAAFGKPTLTGSDAVQVLYVEEGVTVTIRHLTIRDGNAAGSAPADAGGGVANDGVVTLKSVIVRGNHTIGNGGGIANRGTLTLKGHTVIKNNHATFSGGGVLNDAIDRTTTLTMNGTSVIRANHSGSSGGGVALLGSTLEMNGSSSIHHNESSINGGGVAVVCTGTLTGVVGGGNVHDNTPNDVANLGCG